MKSEASVRKVKKDEEGRDICVEVKLIAENEEDKKMIKAIRNSKKPGEVTLTVTAPDNSKTEIEIAL